MRKIETSHHADDCLTLGKWCRHRVIWRTSTGGCRSGIHTGWALIDADSEAQARLAVPSLVREQPGL